MDKPSAKQIAALAMANHVPELLYGGAAGGGKSSYLLQGASQYADNPDSHSLLLRARLTDLTLPGALIHRSKEWWLSMQGPEWSEKRLRWTFPSGATITFGYLDDVDAHERYSGSEFTFIGIDESGEIPIHQLEFMPSRLRRRVDSVVPTQYRLCSNPRGQSKEWMFENFVESDNVERIFLPAFLADNPGVDAEDYGKRLQRLSPVLRAQLLRGAWDVDEDGGIFDTKNWQVVDWEPRDDEIEMKVRYWDMARTEPSEKNPDPDYTVGALLILFRGMVMIRDIVRLQAGPAGVLRTIRDTAEKDGRETHIVIEEEPGASGKDVVFHYARELPGFIVEGDRPSGPKPARASLSASAFDNGTLIVYNGLWLRAMRQEFAAFTGEDSKKTGIHDDQVDAVSGGMAWMFGDRIHVAIA